MLELLEEYEEHLTLARSLCASLHMLARTYSGDAMTQVMFALSPLESFKPMVQREERRHFNSHAKRNDRMRAKMERARRAKGVPERNSPTYAMQQRGRPNDTSGMSDGEYAQLMQNQPITDADIAPFRGEPLQSFAEATRTARAQDTSDVKAQEAIENAIANADRGTISGDEII